MSLLSILVAIIVIGIILYVINNYIPMDPKIKNILNIVVVIVLVLWLLRVFGVWAYMGNLRV
jgi:hypothetical protein